MEIHGDDAGIIDVDKTMETLEPEKTSGGGLCVPRKDRMVFRAPERKSLLGLDVLGIAKRAEAKVDSGFKAPRERVASVVASLEEEENSESSGLDEVGSDANSGTRNHAGRQYRESTASKTGGTVTQDDQVMDTPRSHRSSEYTSSEVRDTPSRSYQNSRSRSPMYERDDREHERRYYSRSERSTRHSRSVDRENYHRREARDQHDQDSDGEYERKRSRHEGSRRTPGRSDWDDGRLEWEDTPVRDNQSHTSRRHQPSPSPMYVGASPDARLVSPWLGGHTPLSTGSSNSPWDHVSPSPVPIRASGSSLRSSSSRHGGRSHQLMGGPISLLFLQKIQEQWSSIYMKRNTEHDPPYWRGPIWMNMNYMILSALHHYSKEDGPYRDKSRVIYDDLRTNLISMTRRRAREKVHVCLLAGHHL